jgi:alkaline phosphatase D
MVQLLLGPIVGGLSATSANLWARADGAGILHAWVGQTPDLSEAQLVGQSLPLSAPNGFAGVAPVQDLTPDTHYHYALILDDTPPDPRKGPYPEFTTFPPPGQKAPFAFAIGSCFRPEGEHEGQIFQALEARRQHDNLRFILLMGDQIYADAYQHNGIGKIAATLDDYRAVYHHTWKRPPLRHLLANLPAFMTLDDHEVDDDWCWSDSQRRQASIPWWNWVKRRVRGLRPRELSRQRVQDALKAYWEHQGMHAPTFHLPPHFDQTSRYTLAPNDPGSLAYSFTFGAAAFFVLDARTCRVRSKKEQQKTILGDDQWAAFEAWLLSVQHTYPLKFLVTSSALLMRLLVDVLYDRWGGFRSERDRFLGLLADNHIEGVYLLSGDLHAAHAVSAELETPSGHPLPLWEFCATPFEQRTPWLAQYTFNPVPFGRVKRLRRHFTIARPNFGVVRVNFADTGEPQVAFEVYGKEGQHLNSVQTQASL